MPLRRVQSALSGRCCPSRFLHASAPRQWQAGLARASVAPALETGPAVPGPTGSACLQTVSAALHVPWGLADSRAARPAGLGLRRLLHAGLGASPA